MSRLQLSLGHNDAIELVRHTLDTSIPNENMSVFHDGAYGHPLEIIAGGAYIKLFNNGTWTATTVVDTTATHAKR